MPRSPGLMACLQTRILVENPSEHQHLEEDLNLVKSLDERHHIEEQFRKYPVDHLEEHQQLVEHQRLVEYQSFVEFLVHQVVSSM